MGRPCGLLEVIADHGSQDEAGVQMARPNPRGSRRARTAIPAGRTARCAGMAIWTRARTATTGTPWTGTDATTPACSR